MSYTHIETVTVGSGGASSITFTSIPQDGTDLVCLLSVRSEDTGGDEVTGQINGGTANQSHINLRGSGTSVLSFGGGNYRVANINQRQYGDYDEFTTITIYISNYSSSTAKSISTDYVMGLNEDVGNIYAGISAALFDDTTAISSLGFTTNSGLNFSEHCTASLYKITADGDGTVTTS